MTKHRAHEVWPYLMIALFWLIGVATILGAINMGRRRATLIVESGRLALTQTGIWGTKHRMWERGEIAAIRADKSGMEMNDRPVIELQIHPVAGKKAGFFGGRDDDELRWIATELRQALDVPASSDSSAVARRAQEAP